MTHAVVATRFMNEAVGALRLMTGCAVIGHDDVVMRAAAVETPRHSSTTPARATSRAARARWLLVLVLLIGALAYARPAPFGHTTSLVVVSGTSMYPTLSDHDVVVVRKASAYSIGDIIAFEATAPQVRVIHRIVGGSTQDDFITRGDNRDADDPWRAKPTDIIGRKVLRIPRAGYAIAFLTEPLVLAAMVLLLALSFVWTLARDQRNTHKASVSATSNDVASAIAARIQDRYAREPNTEARRAIRWMAFSLAVEFRAADRRFDKAAFLNTCGIDETATHPHRIALSAVDLPRQVDG